MREAPGLLLAPLSSAACTLPPTLHPRISAAISAFTQSLAAFLHFFKVCPVFCHFHRFQSPQHATTIDPLPFPNSQRTFLSAPRNRPPYVALCPTGLTCMLLASRCTPHPCKPHEIQPQTTPQPPNHPPPCHPIAVPHRYAIHGGSSPRIRPSRDSENFLSYSERMHGAHGLCSRTAGRFCGVHEN